MISKNITSQKISTYQEHLRQARWSFNLAMGFVGLTAGLTLSGYVLFVMGYISQGSFMAASGIAASPIAGRCVQLARETNDRLDKSSQLDESSRLSK